MNRFVLFLFALLMMTELSAQDKHFTQFYSAPLTLNPALTGAFSGRYRVSGIYRDQWRGVLDQPYQTYAVALDVSFDVKTNSKKKDKVAIGLLFFTDKVNSIDFTTNQIALSGAYRKSLDRDNKQTLTLGIQAGLGQRNINYENITFDDQFNDLNSFDRPTRENLPENNFAFSDYAVGLSYSIAPRRDLSFNAGGALHHIFTPQVSFFATEENSDGIPLGDNKLFRKYSAQVSANIGLTDRVALIPRFLFANQGPHLEMNVGTNIRYGLNDFNGNAIQFGTWVRPVKNETGQFFMDAIVIMTGIELGGVLFGLSYDINVADLTTFRQGQSALEFSVTYLGDYENESVLCPKF